MSKRYELTTKQWNKIRSLLPPEVSGGRGRPRKDNRTMLNAILWILCTGSQWRMLPESYGAWQSVHARYSKWKKDGILEPVLQVLANEDISMGQLVTINYPEFTIEPVREQALACKEA